LRGSGFILLLGVVNAHAIAVAAVPSWTSPDHYRLLITVNPRGVTRSNSPATVDLNFAQALVDQGGAGTFDPNTVEVIAYDANGNPVVYDASRSGYEQYLLAYWIQYYYGIPTVTLHFVLPSSSYTQYAVYFDTAASGLGQPHRYNGLVGDGDFFSQAYGRRELTPSHFDAFCDLDGDGDLDLFKGGVEPYVYCYENVGGNRFEDRGLMTSGGSLFVLPHAGGTNRSWVTLAFYDWDGDGDQDFFPSFTDGPDMGKIVFYRNTTAENGGRLTFTRVGPLQTASGAYVAGGAQAGGWFPAATFVKDWDGDGDNRTDLIVGSNNHCYLYRNLGSDGAGGWRLAEAVTIQSDGADIVLTNPRFDVGDLDGDGDQDLLASTDDSQLWWYQNTDTSVPRKHPTFTRRAITVDGQPSVTSGEHIGLKVADFTGDGRLDILAGFAWEYANPNNPAGPRQYGWLFENLGPPASPQFTNRDDDHGCPYTERIQICDSGRQNVVRATDWNNDGRVDLITAYADGLALYFRNTGTPRFPVFAPDQKLFAGGQVIYLKNENGYFRHDITDWNNDGLKDIIAASSNGVVHLYLNVGTAANPVLSASQPVLSNGTPIVRGNRAQLTVADWNNDGKKDIIFSDEVNTGFYWYRNIGTDALPVFGSPQQILFGGQAVTYTRPNMGSFIDWDGDGKKDFVASEFEVSIRFYKNTGSGAAGQAPTFANTNGITIVAPPTIMTISGDEVRDWNGDGDMDVLTGQGHAASGLRFYERDYINDSLNNTFPIVTAPADTSAPAPVTNLTLTPGNNQITLSWTNPATPDFTGTLIRYRVDYSPTGPADGTLLADLPGAPGFSQAFVHAGAQAGVTYYYAAFAHDAKPNYATPTYVNGDDLVIPDFDHDGDVDQADFAFLQKCLTPPGMIVTSACVAADLHTDNAVDQSDFAILLDCMGGADRPPACKTP
jgi:FG-GAP-like repeat/Dockerin type I domain